MENQYGITVTNKFNLFLDDPNEDLLDKVIRQKQDAAKQPKAPKGAPKDENDPKAVKNKQNKDKAAATVTPAVVGTASEQGGVTEKADGSAPGIKKDSKY